MLPAAYHRDPHLRELTTAVVRSGRDEAGPFVVLGDTVLYPEGGGQPRDHGTVDSIAVTALEVTDEGYLHRLARPLETSSATVSLDWERRWDHMQQHTGQHLLSAVAEERFGLVTTSFHLGAELSDVELDGSGIDAGLLREIEGEVAREIAAARPVTTRWVEPDDAPGSVRSRGLPAGHAGPLRLVEIAGIDCATCGGTHVATTAEIGGLALLGCETMRGGTRVFFVAGERWRRRLARDEEILATLRRQLGCGDAELAEIVARRLEETAELRRTLHRAAELRALAVAESLGALRDPVVAMHLEEADGSTLRAVAQRLPRSDRRLFLLTAASGEAGFFLLAGAPEDPRVGELGPRVAELIGGRGGGKGGLFQGKTERLDRRDEALALLLSSDPG